MRRELVWALAASALLSTWALLNPESRPARSGVVAPVERTASPPLVGLAAAAPSTPRKRPSAQGIRSALPPSWPMPAIETASRSPFASPVPSPPEPVATAIVPPPPPPPQVSYRFWGSLIAPGGEHVLYVARDDNAQPIAVHIGTRLEGGFEVEQVTPAAIVLLQSGSQQRVTLSMAPPSSVGAR